MKRSILLILLVLVIFIGWYGFHEYNRKAKDLSNSKVDVSTDAATLINAFENDSSNANKKYTDKIIEVTGSVKKIDADSKPVILFLGKQGQMSSVKCSIDSTHQNEFSKIKNGAVITIRGKCTGGVTEDVFGTDVTLNYCVLKQKDN